MKFQNCLNAIRNYEIFYWALCRISIHTHCNRNLLFLGTFDVIFDAFVTVENEGKIFRLTNILKRINFFVDFYLFVDRESCVTRLECRTDEIPEISVRLDILSPIKLHKTVTSVHLTRVWYRDI